MNVCPRILVLLLLCVYTCLSAQTDNSTEQLDEVYISDTRFKIPKSSSGKSVIKITKRELEFRQAQTIAQIINSKSGITINGTNSHQGVPVSTFVRGGQNRQVLVLIDGVAVNDPSQIENNFDLNLLSIDQIDSIEILKGPSSTLYGNSASTAVINIRLKTPVSDKISGSLTSFIGTNSAASDPKLDLEDLRSRIGVNGKFDKFKFVTNFNYQHKNGLSAIKSPSPSDKYKEDSYRRINSRIHMDYEFSKKLSIGSSLNLDRYNSDYDNSFTFSDASNSLENEHLRFQFSPKFKYDNGSFHINFSHHQTRRVYNSSYPTKFKASSLFFDLFNKHRFNDKLALISGIQHSKTQMNSYSIPFEGITFVNDLNSDVANNYLVDPYMNLIYISDVGFNLNAGLRWNYHNIYGHFLVYNFNPSFRFKIDHYHLKLFASIGSAYITPSLYQLFDPYYGNTNLDPQEDYSKTFGVDLQWSEVFNISVEYFRRNQQQTIEFVVLDYETYASEYQNAEDTDKVHGIELSMHYNPLTTLGFTANYTFIESDDLDLFRLSKHKINAVIDYNFNSKLNLSFDFQHNSKRTSPFLNDEMTANRILDAYTLCNFNSSYKISKERIKLFLNIHNVFNVDYEELYGFTTLGRNIQLGLQINL